MSQEKKQWKVGLIGFGAGMLVMLTGNMLSNLTEKNNNLILEKEILPEQNRTQQELIDETELNQLEIGNAEEKANETETGIKASATIEISEDFTKKLILYQYIEYGLRKYSGENNQKDRYFCDIEEDLLSYDTEFAMKNEGDMPYKIDLPKEIIPELANNIYNFRLRGDNDNIYMTIDTYNMKISVYDQIK